MEERLDFLYYFIQISHIFISILFYVIGEKTRKANLQSPLVASHLVNSSQDADRLQRTTNTEEEQPVEQTDPNGEPPFVQPTGIQTMTREQGDGQTNDTPPLTE